MKSLALIHGSAEPVLYVFVIFFAFFALLACAAYLP